MEKDKEPSFWVTLAKLVIGATVLIGGTGLILNYFHIEQKLAEPESKSAPNKLSDWGLSKDSPIPARR